AFRRLAAGGGKPALLILLAAGERMQRWPQMLPGSQAVLFSSLATNGNGWDAADIVVQKLPDGPRTIVQEGGFFGRYLRSGHIVFVQQGTLFAAPFDVSRLELTGPPIPAIEA